MRVSLDETRIALRRPSTNSDGREGCSERFTRDAIGEGIEYVMRRLPCTIVDVPTEFLLNATA